ncbi:hypothetical protein GDO78_013969 [Eleutherodactylus coqui]|uniref:Uncharacterized protein n=1 Tax=Eleutherodactylus coqui TaxID=57060 RepID=A0A8J6ELW8_ELECQ|nr:hypothetical protein GDO78_013969 [Eleutherodactylus coqui]
MTCPVLLRGFPGLRALGRLSPLPGLGGPSRRLQYVQGQSPEPRTREYFYYIDHQGQLFLDDTKVKNFITCFKDKQFLAFFFKRVQRNESGRYMDNFPYISPCGRETNYIRCDDRPVVFTHLLSDESLGAQHLSYCGGGVKLIVKFEPEKLVMLPENGRVYHPAPEKTGGVGLVKSSLAFELSPCFEFPVGSKTEPPICFHWQGKRHDLSNELLALI